MTDRFEFGRNWASFLTVLDEARIREAERSLAAMVDRDQLRGATFIDVGSGSGLFSLAAMRLGARRVHSFDYDPDSVACTRELRRRYFPDAAQWTVEQGSALDADYLRRLGQWDVVYSWGVLHHTGDMWRAIDLVTGLVAPSGRLFIAIYNDQGPWSRVWTAVKRFYNRGTVQRWAVLSVFVPYWAVRGLLVDLLRLKNPLRRYDEYRTARGMSVMHDWKDWLGGYPFEVATPERVFEFCQARGFTLARLKTCGGTVGCNEFVFARDQPVAARNEALGLRSSGTEGR
jgi:2-polyprenyl-6-hydroxyphenyl methylase/3-demethylubiquinone-9 3-methyltransferase